MKLGEKLPLEHDALLFFKKWHRIFYMASHTDTEGHSPTKAFDFTVMDH